MRPRLRSILVSLYLLLCILLGGSAQGVWTNLALQLIGVALIAWAAIAPVPPAEGAERPTIPYVLLGLGGAIVLLQLVPLPSELWTALPGRDAIARGFSLIGKNPPALPISEAPYDSVATLFTLIPALAVFVGVTILRPSPRWLALAIVAGTACSVALGALQVAGGAGSWAYIYPIHNPGAVGVFANRNHMGTLLLVSIPFATALLVSAKTERTGSRQGLLAVGIAALALILVGLLLNGSLAALALVLPIILASASLLPGALRWRRAALGVAMVALAAAMIVLARAPIATGEGPAETVAETRPEIWRTTMIAIGDNLPTGTGLGTFREVYQQYEDPSAVSTSYVNHAHNDYLELVLELGLPGLLLILLFLGWWIAATVQQWTSPLSTPFGRAGAVASAAILAHSVVDFPLRTAAIASIFAVAIALMAQRLHSAEHSTPGEKRSGRHVKLG